MHPVCDNCGVELDGSRLDVFEADAADLVMSVCSMSCLLNAARKQCAPRCAWCSKVLTHTARRMTHTPSGEDVVVGVECGCYAQWVNAKEIREFEDSGVIR